MSKTGKALVCPICGRMPSIERSGPGNLVWYIECDGDDNDGNYHQVSVQGNGTKNEAIASWNTRTRKGGSK